MKSMHYAFLVSALLTSSLTLPATAEGLLGGLLGGDNGTALVNLNSGPATGDGLVNVGLGGGGNSGNVLDVDVGGSSAPLVNANVSAGGGSNKLLGVDVNVGNNLANASVGVGGAGGRLTDVTVGVGGSSGSGISGGSGPNQVPNAVGDNPGVRVARNNANGSSSLDPECAGASVAQLVKLVRSTRVDSSWGQASNVEVQPVQICADVRHAVRAELNESGIGPALRNAVQADSLISASLSRTRYDAGDVIAVQQSGNRLTVFVN